MTVAKPNRCSSDQFLTPFVFLQRWKQEEINIGLSHHLLVHCSKVRHPAEDFDYFLLVCQTRSSLRSLSLFSPFFYLLFTASFFFAFFSLLLPLLFVLFQSHLVVFDSPGLACCDLFPSHIDPASISPHGGQIKTHADHPQVTVWARGQRSKWAGQGHALCSVREQLWGWGFSSDIFFSISYKHKRLHTWPNHIHVDIILKWY